MANQADFKIYIGAVLVDVRVTGDRIRREQATIKLANGAIRKMAISRIESMARWMRARSRRPAKWRAGLAAHLAALAAEARRRASTLTVDRAWRAKRARSALAGLRVAIVAHLRTLNITDLLTREEVIDAIGDVGRHYDEAIVDSVLSA